MGVWGKWGLFWGGGGLGVSWDIGRFVGDFGGRDSRSERFGDLNDIDIMLLNIDWIGSLGDPNDKTINHPEVTCWSLDFTGVSREAWVPNRVQISGDIDIALY